MVAYHHTAALTVDKDRTVLYQLDLQRDQLKATSIYLLVQMEEPDLAVRLAQRLSQLVHRPRQRAARMVDRVLTA